MADVQRVVGTAQNVCQRHWTTMPSSSLSERLTLRAELGVAHARVCLSVFVRLKCRTQRLVGRVVRQRWLVSCRFVFLPLPAAYLTPTANRSHRPIAGGATCSARRWPKRTLLGAQRYHGLDQRRAPCGNPSGN